MQTPPHGAGVADQLHWPDLEGRSLVELTRMGGHRELASILERETRARRCELGKAGAV